MRKGRFLERKEAGNVGSLRKQITVVFLDEIGELSANTQAKLLRTAGKRNCKSWWNESDTY